MLKNLKVFKQGYRFELFCTELYQQTSHQAQFGVVNINNRNQISSSVLKFKFLFLHIISFQKFFLAATGSQATSYEKAK